MENLSFIREQDPLKQGLKHEATIPIQLRSPIREQDPLKQGLKLRFEHISIQFTCLFESKIH